MNGTYHGNGFNGYSGRPLATRNMGPRKYAKMGKRNGQSNGPLWKKKYFLREKVDL